MRLTLMSYNLCRGGVGRADPIAEVILAVNPDLLGLHEAVDDEVVRHLARRTGLNALPIRGSPGAVLLSRYSEFDARSRTLCVEDRRLHLVFARGDKPVEINPRSAHAKAADVVIAFGTPDAAMPGVAIPSTRRVSSRRRSPRDEGSRASEPEPATHDDGPAVRVARVDGATVSRLAPPRQLDWIAAAPSIAADLRHVTDRLAVYASDHLPGVMSIPIAPGLPARQPGRRGVRSATERPS
jgi:hypothetical protein